jgi:hypothetical protein
MELWRSYLCRGGDELLQQGNSLLIPEGTQSKTGRSYCQAQEESKGRQTLRVVLACTMLEQADKVHSCGQQSTYLPVRLRQTVRLSTCMRQMMQNWRCGPCGCSLEWQRRYASC